MTSPGWAVHLPPGTSWTPPDGTLPEAWSLRWAEQPERPVVFTARTGWVTAAELDDRAWAAAGALQEAGLLPGDRVLMSASASVDLVAMHVGALRSGLVVVPTNTGYTATELRHVADDSGARAGVLDDPSRGPGIAVVPVDARGGSAPAPGPAPDDPALICYTSGTTGKPKGAVLTHRNLLVGAEAVRLAWRWTPEDRLVSALPLFHMHGLGVGLHGTLLAGGSIVLLPRFDPDEVLDAIRDQGATMFFGVPTMYSRLAASDRRAELKSLRLCVAGSAPLPPDLHARLAEESGQQVLERYGMTETLMNTSNPYDGERRAGSVGLPLPGVELRLAEAGGEIEVRGPNVFAGYWRNADATARAITDDGWFKTGDVGALDPDGYVRIVGRTKELIITGGFNVYPREVEETLEGHPAVSEAAVAGTPDPEWGEIVTAYVVVSAPVTEVELADHCRATLAPYKRPRLFHFVGTLPRNALGKIDRSALAVAPPPK